MACKFCFLNKGFLDISFSARLADERINTEREKRTIPLRASRDLHWRNKPYKLMMFIVPLLPLESVHCYSGWFWVKTCRERTVSSSIAWTSAEIKPGPLWRTSNVLPVCANSASKEAYSGRSPKYPNLCHLIRNSNS